MSLLRELADTSERGGGDLGPTREVASAPSGELSGHKPLAGGSKTARRLPGKIRALLCDLSAEGGCQQNDETEMRRG